MQEGEGARSSSLKRILSTLDVTKGQELSSALCPALSLRGRKPAESDVLPSNCLPSITQEAASCSRGAPGIPPAASGATSAVWEQRAHPHPVLHCIMESGMHNKSRAVALFEASGLGLHTLCSERGKKQTCRTLCSSHSPVLLSKPPGLQNHLKPGKLPTPRFVSLSPHQSSGLCH